MKPQIITTPEGSELVVLTRREYDALLAATGDEEAEDRMTALIVEESRARIASGEEALLPAGPDGRPPRPALDLPVGKRIKA